MNIIEKRIKAKSSDTVKIIPIGDTHVGSICFDRKYFEDMVTWICNEPHTYVIGMGDMVDAVTHMDVARYDVDNLDPEFNTPEKQHKYVEKWLGKLAEKDKLLFILEGNHEYEIKHRYNHEHCTRWSTDLKVPFLGVQGLMRLVIEENYNTKKNKARCYDIFAHHGHGGGSKTGNAVNKIQNFANNYYADIYLMGHCLSLDTEILTENGWRGFGQIERGDNVMSLNMSSGILELNKVNDLYIDEDSREHVLFKANNLDMAVTPSHNVVYKTMSTGKFMKKKANELLGSTFKIPLCGDMEFKGCELSDEMLRLYGWIIAEGGFAGRDYGFTITQATADLDVITQILDRLDMKYSVYNKDHVGRRFTIRGRTYETKKKHSDVYVHSEDAKKIREHFVGRKLVPKDLMDSMTKEQFLKMFNTMVEGDGYRMSDSEFIYYTADEELADQIQIMCVTRGIKCTKKERRGNFELLINTRFIDVSLSPSRENVSVRQLDENEFSWCVSVDNGTLVTRRNGKVCITGNTHDKFANIEARVKINDQKNGDGNLELSQKKIAFVNTGTFMDTFKVGTASTYAERKGYQVKMKGVVTILLKDGDIHLRP